MTTPTTKWLEVHVLFASFDDDLWMLLQNQVMRQRLRDYIIEHKLSDDHEGWGTMAAETLGSLTTLLLFAA